MARFFIIAGLILVGIGLAVKIGLPLGRLPGDIVIQRGNGTFYFPIVTCIVISIVFSLVSYLLRR